MGMQSLYRRPLPEALIEFGSADGRALFREALALGTMESYFALAEQHHTQADPAFCGLGSLVVVLNALAIDPGRLWKGPWRWFSEEMLDCCVSLETVRTAGLTLGEVGCLARCNGAEARVVRASAASEAAFREAVTLLSSRERNLLRYHFLAELSIDQIGTIYQVHRATAARWLARAQERLIRKTRELFLLRTQSNADSLPQIMELIQSQLSVNLGNILKRSTENDSQS